MAELRDSWQVERDLRAGAEIRAYEDDPLQARQFAEAADVIAGLRQELADVRIELELMTHDRDRAIGEMNWNPS